MNNAVVEESTFMYHVFNRKTMMEPIPLYVCNWFEIRVILRTKVKIYPNSTHRWWENSFIDTIQIASFSIWTEVAESASLEDNRCATNISFAPIYEMQIPQAFA